MDFKERREEMRKEMKKIFFLTLAALFIATTSNSVAPHQVRSASVIQRPEACDYDWGLGKWLNQSLTIDDQTVPLSIKIKCKNKE